MNVEMKLTAGPKKAVLKHLRKKIEVCTEKIHDAKLKEDEARKVDENFLLMLTQLAETHPNNLRTEQLWSESPAINLWIPAKPVSRSSATSKSSTFRGINSKLSNVTSRLPTVNTILSAIKKKKSMDTIILSLVAAVCTFLIFIYW